VITREDQTRHKPHPEPFLKASEALGIAPQDCLALEDSHNGVRAAHAAGMMTIMVPDMLDPTEEMRTLTIRIARDLHEVRDLLEAQRSAIQ
jgi:beta-phosphoglucomutase-like phosphatase (HAD superfamily)